MKCKWKHCSIETETKNNGKPKSFCSRKCKNKYYVDRRRKKLKLLAIEYNGGSCQLCGYNKCVGAMEFHHIDPTKKDFGIASNGNTKSWKRLKEELDKCLILCANCHREIHNE